MRRNAVAAGLVVLLATPALTHAEINDVIIARLSRVVTDSSGTPVRTIAQSAEFRALTSELGTVLAPRLLTPADTLGFGGFQFSADVNFTSIASGASYWRVLQGSADPTGVGGIDHGDSMLSTVGLFVRKGMWLPLPSFELGVGVVHLANSNLWTAQTYAKFALHEGYHEWPLPSLAVRGAASRVFGARSLDLSIASFDVSVSKHVGMGGTWNVNPYVGWNLLFIIPRSDVLDPTPGVDPLMPGSEADGQLDFVFPNQDNITRQRWFAGAKFQYHVFHLTLEGQVALKGRSVDDQPGTSAVCEVAAMTEQCDSRDRARRQRSFTVSAGMEF